MKTHEELAAEILIAALSKGAIGPEGAVAEARAKSLGLMYGIILDGLQNPKSSGRLPKD